MCNIMYINQSPNFKFVEVETKQSWNISEQTSYIASVFCIKITIQGKKLMITEYRHSYQLL